MPAKQIRANIPSSGQRFLIHWAYLFVHVNAATYVVLLGTLREGTEAQGSLGNLICWVISRLSFVLVPWIRDQRRMAWTYVQHDILNIPAVNKSWCLPLSQLKVKVNVQFLCIILVWCLRLEDSWDAERLLTAFLGHRTPLISSSSTGSCSQVCWALKILGKIFISNQWDKLPRETDMGGNFSGSCKHFPRKVLILVNQPRNYLSAQFLSLRSWRSTTCCWAVLLLSVT